MIIIFFSFCTRDGGGVIIVVANIAGFCPNILLFKFEDGEAGANFGPKVIDT